MTKKRGKKEKNEEKLKKMMQKDAKNALCFQNRAISRRASRVRLPMAQVASGVDCGGWEKC
jgi:hypothetical protein